MAVFHFLRERNGRAAVRVEGHDPVVRDLADIVCTRRDGVGRPDVVQNVVADLLIGLGRRVQSPPNRFLRQQLVCARCVREVLVVAYLCASVNKFVDSERRDVAAGFAFFRYHRHNVLIEIDERYGDAVITDIQTAVLAEGMDAVGLAAGRDLGNLAPVGRRMGELDQIVNAGFYRRGCPRIVFPADVPAQRVLGVQVVRRILLERLHKVCDREGHDPCGIILAFYKRILLPDNTRLCGILPLTAVHVVVAVLPEAVDAGDGNKAIQRAEDILAGRRFNHLADDFNDRQVTLLLPFPVPVNSCFGVIAEGDGQRCVLLVNEPMLDAGGLVICHQIRRYRDRRGDVVALLVLLHIADRILRRGGNIIRLVRMCCFVVLADDSKAAVQRRGLCGRGHFMRGFDPRVRCRFHPLLIRLIIGEVERDGLRGRGVLHLPDQIAGLLHEPCRPDSHRADISARAIAYDLADRMLCVGRVSERILYRIMRSGCRNADNIYINAGHVVFRGLGGLVGGWGLLAVLNLDHTQAVVQLPRVILVADYKLQRCLVRIVELMRLRFFAVVLCDIRRGLDGHVVFPRLIQSRRFRPVERLALRVVDQVVVFRPAAGRADVHYLNLPDSGFQIVIGGNRNKRGLRSALFPNGVDGLGAVFMFNVNRTARLILRSGRSRTVSPALEGVAFLGRDLIADGKGNLVHRWMRCRTRLTSRRTGAAIRIILQFKEWHPDGVDSLGRILLGQYDRISALVLRSHSIRLVRPSNMIIARAGQLRSINIKREGSRRRGPIRHIREPCAVRAVVILIIQIVHVGRSGVGFLRDQINRIRCLRSSRTGGVEVKNCGVLLGLFRPANEFIARIQLAFQRRNADISELADQNRMIEARMACAILACIGLINRHAIVIASVELIADIKNLVLDCLCFIRFQRLRTDTVVSRKGRHRQHAEHHNQN